MPKNTATATKFGALIQEYRKQDADPDTQTPEISATPGSLSVPKSLAKSQDPNYVKLTAYVPRQVHMDMKLALTQQGREISHFMTELITDWLRRKDAK
jgi:hypothetical protein